MGNVTITFRSLKVGEEKALQVVDEDDIFIFGTFLSLEHHWLSMRSPRNHTPLRAPAYVRSQLEETEDELFYLNRCRTNSVELYGPRTSESSKSAPC